MARILLSSDSTVSAIVPHLQKKMDEISGADTSWKVIEQGFNQWLIEVLNPASSLNKDKPEFLILLLSPRFLEDREAGQKLRQFLNEIDAWKGETQVFFSQLVADPVEAGALIEIPRRQQAAAQFNAELEKFQLKHRWFHLIDMASFFAREGLDKMHDPRYEILARMYFSPGGSKAIAAHIARYVHASIVPSKKVLVLDLDNTLWGGILGEENRDGIELGNEGIGYAFTRFQQSLLLLKDQGILLAINSKNNESDVRDVFDKHPGMRLKWTDFVGWRINWLSKVENLRSLAQELNLGLESFAVFDDSPFEREQIHQLIPEVDILNVPKDPADYVRALSDYTGFDKLNLTDEDFKRSEMYRAEAMRQSMQKQASSLEEFYQALEMKAEISKVDDRHFNRAHQLIQKTNQFNLTTQRYTETELRQLISSPTTAIFMLNLTDKLGESGMTGIIVVRMNQEAWIIENLLLSCRIIGRTVEHALIQWLAEKARKQGVKYLKGRFIPTKKNQPAALFYQNAGFDYDAAKDQWILDLQQLEIPKNYVSLEDKT